MITRLRIKNFKALRDVEVQLTPIHVLIGPNDSGKTSILDALAALCRSMDHDLCEAFLGSWKGTELVWAGKPDVPVSIDVDFDSDIVSGYSTIVRFGARDRRIQQLQGVISRSDFPGDKRGSSIPGNTGVRRKAGRVGSDLSYADELRIIKELLDGVHYYRWDPRFLALPVAPDSKRRFRMESNGFGLALCLDEILSFDRDRFIGLERRFTDIFPHITSIKLLPEMAYRAPVDNPDRITVLKKADGKGLYFRLSTADQLVPASQISDGTLLVLAYLAVLYLPQPPRVLLVEEPENGVHPKRLRDVLGVLRELITEQSHTQVILTTHSPYVLDLFSPEEVTLCTMQGNGEVKTTRLSDSPAVKRQLDVFTLGEIWTSEGDEAIAQARTATEESDA
jgi:energy-coupling factor transporter ATP-binding protein EcfA2